MVVTDDLQLTLPYFANNLPAPLPTQEQIENTNDILAEVAGCRVVRVGEHFVVKYGTNNEEVEAAAMIYLRRTTSMNIPEVYAMYRSGIKNALFVVIEFIPGDNLARLWPSLTKESEEQICLCLREQMDELRSLPPLGYLGGVGRRPMPDGIFWIYERETPHINGPFYSEDELNNALVEKTRLADEIWGRRGPQKAQFYQLMLPKVFRNHATVFTHTDIQRKNIMVRSHLDETVEWHGPQVSKYHVTIVDWEFVGWYPSYWEFCVTSWPFRFDDDWPEYVEKIMDPWHIEYAWLRLIRDSLWT